MLLTKEFITDLSEELFPGLGLQVAFGHEGLGASFPRILDSLGVAAIELNAELYSYTDNPIYDGVRMRVLIGAQAVQIFWCNPQRLEAKAKHNPALPLYVTLHETAHAAIDVLADIEGHLREAFEDHSRMEGNDKKRRAIEALMEEKERELDALEQEGKSPRRQLTGEYDMLKIRKLLLERARHEADTLYGTGFIHQRLQQFAGEKGRTIAGGDIAPFFEAVCDLFACVETARRMENSVTDALRQRAGEVRQATCEHASLLNMQEMTGRTYAVLDHYTAPVLDAVAAGNWHEGRRGYALLEACIAETVKHFVPLQQTIKLFQNAQKKGLLCGKGNRADALAAAKIEATEPTGSDLALLAAWVKNHPVKEAETARIPALLRRFGRRVATLLRPE
jgi:hypothetical protein